MQVWLYPVVGEPMANTTATVWLFILMKMSTREFGLWLFQVCFSQQFG
jgi:hypothetical protein